MFKLPKLTTVVDCGPIGYPGLEIEFWLNPPNVEYTPPKKAEPWDAEFWYALGRGFERITIPAGLTESGEPRVIEVTDAKVIYDLFHDPTFDPQVINWSFSQYGKRRQERLKIELGN